MRLVILFIPLFLVGCSSLGYERSQNGTDKTQFGTVHAICTDGVQAYLKNTKKVEASGLDAEHLQILCK